MKASVLGSLDLETVYFVPRTESRVSAARDRIVTYEKLSRTMQTLFGRGANTICHHTTTRYMLRGNDFMNKLEEYHHFRHDASHSHELSTMQKSSQTPDYISLLTD